MVSRFLTSRRAMTLVEVMGMMVIVSLWLLTLWQITYNGQILADNTENRIRAINLAREWIEIITNIRDTNWVKFSSDRKNCWRTLSYDIACVWNGSHTANLSGTYIVYLSGMAWYTQDVTPTVHTGMYLDEKGLPYQTGWTIPTLPRCTVSTLTGCTTLFTRQITVTPINDGSTGMLVNVQVDWRDKQKHSIALDVTLTNWKVNN